MLESSAVVFKQENFESHSTMMLDTIGLQLDLSQSHGVPANDPKFENICSADFNAASHALDDKTYTIDPFNKSGGKPGTEKSFDQMSAEEYAEWATPADMNIGGNGGGGLYRETKEEREEKERDELNAALEDIAQQQTEEARREEHARKWDQEMHDFGGQKLSGQQINNIYDWFSKAENQEIIRQKLKAEGKTQDEIDQTFEKIKERQSIWERLRNGTASKEDEKKYEQLGKDKNVITAEGQIAKEVDKDAVVKQDVKFKSNEYKDDFNSRILGQLKNREGGTVLYRDNISGELNSKSVKTISSISEASNEAYQYFKAAPIMSQHFNAALQNEVQTVSSPDVNHGTHLPLKVRNETLSARM